MPKKLTRIPVRVDGEQVGSIFLRSGSSNWWFDLLRPFRKQFSLGTSNEDEAQELAKQKAAEAPKIPTAPTFAEKRERAKQAENLGRALVRYLRGYKKENRHSSWSRARRPLSAFVTFCGGWRKAPSVITRKVMIAYRDERAEKATRATANGDLSRAKAFVNWMRAEELIEGDPTFKVKRLKMSTVAEEAISPAAVAGVIKGFGEGWLADLAVVLANVGLRPQEALNVRACDVDEKQRLLRVRPWELNGYKWQVKDYEERALALNDVALAVLMKRHKTREGEGLLWPSPTGKAWDYDNFAKLWRKALPATLRGMAYPYAFRHYFATQAVLAGWPIEKLSKYLGHANISTTQRYYADMRALTQIGAPPVLAQELKKAQA
jgi:integrase